MRRRIVGIAILAILGLVAAEAMAANVHFKGPKGGPNFRDLGLTLRATGTLAGLGNEDILVTLDATAQPTSQCTNPSGSNQPPGQNPAEVDVSGSTAIPAERFKNGSVGFTVTTDPPVTPIPGAPDCPNPQWTEEITDMAFTSATITVEQPAGTPVLTVTCSFNPATANGAVSKTTVSCG